MKWGIYAIWFLANFYFYFARNLFNFIDHILVYCFACNFLNGLVCLICVVMIYLTIFPTPILFLLCNYTITIYGNVRKSFEIFGALFRIRCTSLWFIMTAINIILHVLVCGKYLLYLKFYYIHSLFRLTYGRPVYFARALIHWT